MFPTKPAHLYGMASKEDIYSVIAYLRTLPSHDNTVPPPSPKFPFSLIMNTIPKKVENGTIPSKENIVEYGKYMITLAACIDCHTPMEKGKFNMDLAFSGNQEFILPTGIVRSSNITPDVTTGIGGWTEETFLARFKIYSDSSYVQLTINEGFNTIMPWTTYTKVEEYDLKAIFAYLKSLEPINQQVVKFSPY